MATLNFYQAVDMANPYIYYGVVTSATSSSITIDDLNGNRGIYYGTFSYDVNGNLAGGTVTGYDNYLNYSLDYTGRNGSLDALTVENYLNNNNPVGLQQYALSGNDTIIGSVGADTLIGWGGNDLIAGNGGSDILYGGVGDDTFVVTGTEVYNYIDGGTGTDTVQYNNYSSAQAVSLISQIGLSADGSTVIFKDDTGFGTVKSVEKLTFTDGTVIVEDFLNLFATVEPLFSSSTGGVSSYLLPDIFTGSPTLNLQYQLIDNHAGAVVSGRSSNDFIKLGGTGNKAMSGGGGNDILDGGTGSTFVSSGGTTANSNTFFLDGRAAGASWSTITDFHAGH